MSLTGKATSGGVLRGKISKLDTLKGYSAYEVACINGFKGTEAEWLASLKGEKGDTGRGFKITDYYTSLEALETAVPSPSVGDAYGVGASIPYDIYIYSASHGWVNNGAIGAASEESLLADATVE